jgi:hypothetical protein
MGKMGDRPPRTAAVPNASVVANFASSAREKNSFLQILRRALGPTRTTNPQSIPIFRPSRLLEQRRASVAL